MAYKMVVDLQKWEEILGTFTDTKIKTTVGIPRKAAWGDSPVGSRAETFLSFIPNAFSKQLYFAPKHI